MSTAAAHTGLQGMGVFSFARAPHWLSCSLLAALVIVPTYDFRPDAGEKFGLDTQLLVRLAVCGVCGLYGLCYWRSTASFLTLFPGAWMLLLIGWAAATLPLAVQPAYAAAACGVLACAFFFVPAVLVQLGRRTVLRTLLAAITSYIGLAWTLYFLFPSIGRSPYLVDGVIEYRVGGDAQQLGLQAVWLICVALTLSSRKELSRSATGGFVLFGLLTIAFAQSRTSLLAALAVGVVWLCLRRGRRTAVAAALTGGAVLAAGLFAYGAGLFEVRRAAVLTSVSRTGTEAEIFNITGRATFWPYVLECIAESPVTGYGYGSARHALVDFDRAGIRAAELSHAHNMLLNTALTTGLVGAAIYAAMLLGLFDSVLRYRELFPVLVLVVILLFGLTESPLFGPMPRAQTVIWLFALFWRQSATGPDALSPARTRA
ncbi:MAG: O-antigen ligase family protein [Planctomycetota bacterium]